MKWLRWSATTAAAVACGALLPASAGAAERIALEEARSDGFPERAYVLTLPDAQTLPEAEVVVNENGEPVESLDVSTAGERSAVVLAIDNSKSMRGEPMEAAMDAARAFAERRQPEQKLGVLFFSGTQSIALEPTADEAKIEEVLAETPELSPGTRLYDATAMAVEMLKETGAAAGSVIVLSDGADAKSAIARNEVIDDANAAHIRLFGVGLESRSFDPASLQGLSSRGGSYAEASSPGDLRGIFSELGERQANEFLLTYRSRQPLQSDVAVSVSVKGIDDVAIAAYRAPDFPVPPAVEPPPPSWWESSTATTSIAIGIALLVALGVWMLVRPNLPTLSRRLSHFTGNVATTEEEEQEAHRARALLARADGRLSNWRPWTEFTLDVELAKLKWPPRRIVIVAILLTLAVTAGLVLLEAYIYAIMAFIGIPVTTRAVIHYLATKVRRRFEDQLPDNLQVLASALRAGQSFVGALNVMVKDAPEPSRKEFRRVVRDEQLGIPIETSLEVVHDRMRCEDVIYVGLIATLQRETGGNTAEVLDKVVETMRERGKLRRLVRTLTAQGRLGGWIVTALPIAMILFLNLFKPNYLEPMLERTVGWVILIMAAISVALGAYCIRRIVDIRV